MNPLRVGVIGAGAMGLPMARRLFASGHPVSVRDIRVDAQNAAQSAGLALAPSPIRLAADCDLLIIVVVDADQIADVLDGDGGLLRMEGRGRPVLISSTIAPADAARFARELDLRGFVGIDAPVSGGPVRALDGTLSMMLAASTAALDRIEPVTAALATRRFRLSESPGDAARAKLVNNLLAGINLAGAAEALSLAMRMGLSGEAMFELISASSGASWVFQDRMQRVLADDYEARAAMPVLTKDLRLAIAMAKSNEHPVPMAGAALARFEQAIAEGHSREDDAAVIKPYLSGGPGH